MRSETCFPFLIRRGTARRVFSAVCLAAAGLASAAAQTYEFVSCRSGVTLKTTIGSIISKSGPNNLGNGARSFHDAFTGTYSMTWTYIWSNALLASVKKPSLSRRAAISITLEVRNRSEPGPRADAWGYIRILA